MKTPRPRLEKAPSFAMVEKSNPLAVHAIFGSRENGERFIRETVPDYCRRGIYMDKSLTPESFEIIEH